MTHSHPDGPAPESRSPEPEAPGGEDRPGRRRLRVRVRGVVQGVGFRPYVYRLAGEHELGGFVLNDAAGVVVEAEGVAPALRSFLDRLPAEAPPLAAVESVEWEAVPPEGDAVFRIEESEGGARAETLVSPDSATCRDCHSELFDPADRRYRYPFINCTNCGPRFTIVRGVPYDRPLTTMAGFRMCDACRAEYGDPGDRRFHAQPNACPECGPRVRLLTSGGDEVKPGEDRDPVEETARALLDGRIVAVKGLGGYHLACRADDPEAVGRLRRRKHREDKPFALMVPDLDAARQLAVLGPEEEDLLSGVERPIVLAPRRTESGVAAPVAPGHHDLGLMLPYTPLHHLLLADAETPLVMTSGNVSDEPIAYRDQEARERLAPIADLFLVHDRPIETRTDDSVVRVVSVAGERRPLVLRRSRGWVPSPVELSPPTPRPLVACGAHLKNTFTVARGSRAWTSHHVGDLENYETLRSFEEGVTHFRELFEVEPEVAVHDLHPDYLSTRWAREREDELETVAVQHHFAHLVACLGEHGRSRPATGLIFDGTGYGTDGTVWGGEILVGDVAGFRRAGHLHPVRLPGGEAAIREPWRMACAWLVEATERAEPAIPDRLEGRLDPDRWATVADLARRGVASPVTTSVGRLFDAVSALCGIRAEVRYEGQAAVELEMAARTAAGAEVGEGYPVELVDEGAKEGGLVLDARPAIRRVVDELARGVDVALAAARFHEGLARAGAGAAVRVADAGGPATVVLSGGVFQNVLLLERTAELLVEHGLEPLVPRLLPPNDGGISYGQAVAAAAALEG